MVNPVSGTINYIGEVISEIKKVTWPSWQQTLRLTVIVIIVSLIVAAFAGGLDFTFTSTLNYILNKP